MTRSVDPQHDDPCALIRSGMASDDASQHQPCDCSATMNPVESEIPNCEHEDGGYVCTRPVDHRGDHIAHGHTGHVCHRWPQIIKG